MSDDIPTGLPVWALEVWAVAHDTVDVRSYLELRRELFEKKWGSWAELEIARRTEEAGVLTVAAAAIAAAGALVPKAGPVAGGVAGLLGIAAGLDAIYVGGLGVELAELHRRQAKKAADKASGPGDSGKSGSSTPSPSSGDTHGGRPAESAPEHPQANDKRACEGGVTYKPNGDIDIVVCGTPSPTSERLDKPDYVVDGHI